MRTGLEIIISLLPCVWGRTDVGPTVKNNYFSAVGGAGQKELELTWLTF